MRLHLKPLVAAVLCLAGAAHAASLVVDKPGTEPDPAPSKGPQGIDKRSPLTALGGSTFDPRSLTGAVTLERLIQELTRRTEEADRSFAGSVRRPPVQSEIAHIRDALSRSGVLFTYQVSKATRLESDCSDAEQWRTGSTQLLRKSCVRYVEPYPIDEPVLLSSKWSSRGVTNATFVLTGPMQWSNSDKGKPLEEVQRATPEGVPVNACANEKDATLRRQVFSKVVEIPGDGPPSEPPKVKTVQLLTVMATLDMSALKSIRDPRDPRDPRGTTYLANAKEREPECTSAMVWAFELPAR